MATLQQDPGDLERSFEAQRPPQNLKSHLKNIRNRLAGIPATPSSTPSRTISFEQGLTGSTTTISTVTTASASRSSTGTEATSLLTLPESFLVQGFYISPGAPINDTIQAVWTQQIKSRLEAILWIEIPAGTCFPEFMMAGKRAHAMKPTLVINCGNNDTKKRVEKSFKGQTWLQELLKSHNIMFLALVAPTKLSMGSSAALTMSTSVFTEGFTILIPQDPITSCGLVLRAIDFESQKQRQCILGGLIMVRGEIVGLTAGHPFRYQYLNSSEHVEELSRAQLLESQNSEENGSEPFVFNADDDTSDENILVSTSTSSIPFANLASTFDRKFYEPYTASEHGRACDAVFHTCEVIIPRIVPKSVSPLEDVPKDYDWAILPTLPPSLSTLPNKISHLDSRQDTFIEKIFPGESAQAYGQVTILLAGYEGQLGCLHPSIVTMKADEYVLDVQLITLERVLPLGCSGTWVILDDQLCGIIVAIREDIPWAYMAPIGSILKDVKEKLGTSDVRLPSHEEIEVLAETHNATHITVSTPNASEVHIIDDDPPSHPETNMKGHSGMTGPWVKQFLEALPRLEPIGGECDLPEKNTHRNALLITTRRKIKIKERSISSRTHIPAVSLSLLKDPDVNTRLAIINTLWEPNTHFARDLYRFNSFFNHYREETSRWARYLAILKVTGMTNTHQDLIDVFQELKDFRATRDTLVKRLQALYPNDVEIKEALLDRALDVGARIFLMTSIEGTDTRNTIGVTNRMYLRMPYGPVLWDGDESLQEVIHRRFPMETQISSTGRLEKLFNANNIEKIAGIQIIWTSNLADHLCLQDGDSSVAIFHHATFLKAMRSCEIFPPGLIEETIQSLALLLPEYDLQSQKWFRIQRRKHGLDSDAHYCGHPYTKDRQMHQYKYWHDRLAILKEAFDDSKPRSVFQWWSDRRNAVTWFTLWIAIGVFGLTMLFGLLQVIQGSLSVYKAYHPSSS